MNNQRKRLIIGVSGKIGSGKDTIGAYLQNKYNFKVQNFAYRVRTVCSEITGIPVNTLLTREAKGIVVLYNHKKITVGELFQLIGNGLRELIHEDVWVNALLNNIKDEDNIVITDVRYPNEVAEIQRRGGIVIRLEGDPANIRKDIQFGKSTDKRDLKAPSETALDGFTFHHNIYNNGTKEKLYRDVDNILKDIKFI
jgi:dephospho-CoA kinase